MKRTALKRSGMLRRRRKPPVFEPGKAAWKEPHQGWCSCGCARFSMHLERHHIVLEQHVRRENGNAWDLANSMLLDPRCHQAHHSAQRRIKIERVPSTALVFALDLLGEGASAAYFERYYDCRVLL